MCLRQELVQAALCKRIVDVRDFAHFLFCRARGVKALSLRKPPTSRTLDRKRIDMEWIDLATVSSLVINCPQTPYRSQFLIRGRSSGLAFPVFTSAMCCCCDSSAGNRQPGWHHNLSHILCSFSREDASAGYRNAADNLKSSFLPTTRLCGSCGCTAMVSLITKEIQSLPEWQSRNEEHYFIRRCLRHDLLVAFIWSFHSVAHDRRNGIDWLVFLLSDAQPVFIP